MKKILLFLFVFSFHFLSGQTIVEQPGFPPMYDPSGPQGSDLCLIYCARPTPMVEYNKETMKSYLVYKPQKAKTQFLYDGFLIFDIRGTENQPLENNPEAVTKEQWTRLLNRYFQPDWAIDAIDDALADLKKQCIVPKTKRKIYIGIPAPYEHKNIFGEIDGKTMTMETVTNRVKATKWYVDEALSRWNSMKYKNVELAGFYWVEEHAREQGDEIIPQMAAYVHQKGYPLIWIPYFGRQNAFAKDWKSLGFDRAFYQPNYFFVNATKAGIPASRVDEAIAFASTHKMAMEFEFDHNVKDTLYQRKFEDYINSFEKNNVFSLSPVAYYEGGGAWALMAQSKDEKVKQLYHKLANIIVARQKKLNKLIKSR